MADPMSSLLNPSMVARRFMESPVIPGEILKEIA